MSNGGPGGIPWPLDDRRWEVLRELRKPPIERRIPHAGDSVVYDRIYRELSDGKYIYWHRANENVSSFDDHYRLTVRGKAALDDYTMMMRRGFGGRPGRDRSSRSSSRRSTSMRGRARDPQLEILRVNTRHPNGVSYVVRVPDPRSRNGYDIVDVLMHDNGAVSTKSANRSTSTPLKASAFVRRHIASGRGGQLRDRARRRRTRRDEVEDGDYTVQGLYSSGHIVGALGGGGGESYSYDNEAEAIEKAKRLLRSPYFEGDATRVIARDGELIWSSEPERDHARRRRSRRR